MTAVRVICVRPSASLHESGARTEKGHTDELKREGQRGDRKPGVETFPMPWRARGEEGVQVRERVFQRGGRIEQGNVLVRARRRGVNVSGLPCVGGSL